MSEMMERLTEDVMLAEAECKGHRVVLLMSAAARDELRAFAARNWTQVPAHRTATPQKPEVIEFRGCSVIVDPQLSGRQYTIALAAARPRELP